jgi:hypothetical protein
MRGFCFDPILDGICRMIVNIYEGSVIPRSQRRSNSCLENKEN